MLSKMMRDVLTGKEMPSSGIAGDSASDARLRHLMFAEAARHSLQQSYCAER